MTFALVRSSFFCRMHCSQAPLFIFLPKQIICFQVLSIFFHLLSLLSFPLKSLFFGPRVLCVVYCPDIMFLIKPFHNFFRFVYDRFALGYWIFIHLLPYHDYRNFTECHTVWITFFIKTLYFVVSLWHFSFEAFSKISLFNFWCDLFVIFKDSIHEITSEFFST